ncbi:sigma-70 family RNA polymerase sigma factor [Nocardioides ferulae]|uniref:sigma-70 family RNA polymerase sigma factor n=1 Tax=Nocardioides ferulae TaxID=2340821 RepID=UPI000EAEB1AA|nr:sigma-70 family RNA polymerase sigma factor [Nocardioides ferulae]
MRDPDGFDTFYQDVRGRLLLQAFALTGDLSSARAAVRDTFVVAWHHWPKVSRSPDPEAWAREHAWSRALRRSAARLRRRDKDLSDEARATLDGLAKLPTVQRKALLLTQLATVSMDQMAREVGLPPEEAARQLQLATAQFAVHRDVPTTAIRPLWEPLAAAAEEVRWPRGSILRRAGAARRRTHTAAGAAATVAALLVTGVVVTDTTGVQPTLDGGHEPSASTRNGAGPATPPEPEEVLPEESLLAATSFDEALAGTRWTVTDTHANTEGTGLVLPCQPERYADRRGSAALVRELAGQVDRPGTRPGGRPSAQPGTRPAPSGPAAYQLSEASVSTERAERTFRATVGWFAGCQEERAQLLSTWQGQGLGDEATIVSLRDWAGAQGPESPDGLVAGVARSGGLVTTVLTRVPGTGPLEPKPVLRLLTEAVDALCRLPDGGECATRPRLRPAPPVPTGQVAAMLSEIDLPPAGEVRRPWVGNEPARAVANDASTTCDQASFSGGFEGVRWSRNLTRTFVVPEARLPDAFGLTETVGALPAAKARAFVAQIRGRMGDCSEDQLGTDVRQLRQVATDATDLSVWEVTTEISDQESVRFLMALLRRGTAVAQLGFVPAPGADLGDEPFLALAERALARLDRLPGPQPRG